MFGVSINRALEIEQLANDVWRTTSMEGPPVSTRKIISKNGIFLQHMADRAPFDAEFDLTTKPYQLFIRNQRSNEDSVRYRRRMRFTEAHELGHFFLHGDVQTVHRETSQTVIEAVASGNFRLAEIEGEANVFASALLMPRRFFEIDLEPSQIQPAKKWMFSLPQRYDVSMAAIEVRIARLRKDYVLSGHAWADTGRIISMIPSMELETAHPEISEKAWRCNPQVQNHVVNRIPINLFREFRRQARNLPEDDIAAAKVEGPLQLNEILLDAENGISGDILLLGCNKGGPKIYFEIDLTNLD